MAKLNFLMSKWDLMTIGHSYASSIVTATYSQTSEKLKTLYESLSGSAWVSGNEGSFDATTRHWYNANDSERIVSSGPMFYHEEIDFEEYSNVRNSGSLRNRVPPEKVRHNDSARISHRKINKTERSRREK
jgi:hypothetical protein